MFDKYLYALGRGVRGAKKAYQDASRAPDPAEAARDITPKGDAAPAPLEAPAQRAAPRPLLLSQRPLVMGIVNVTPDSFSDGGDYLDPAQAIAHGLRLAEEGADILDVGGESTRPGAAKVSVEEEIARVIPVVKGLCAATDLPISIDTMKAPVARAALDAGASIVNDVWGFQHDRDMATLVAERGCPAILMHNRETDDPEIDVMAEVMEFLRRSIDIGLAAGVRREQLVVDPGFGFGKTHPQSLTLVRDLAVLKALGCPILLGVSRKRAIGAATGRSVARERVIGSVAAAVMGAERGAAIIRVHDVAEHVEAMKLFAAVKHPSPETN
jgi:dihydropteroate synthase